MGGFGEARALPTAPSSAQEAVPAPAAPVLLPGLKQSSFCHSLTLTARSKHCARPTAELKLPVSNHTDLWHLPTRPAGNPQVDWSDTTNQQLFYMRLFSICVTPVAPNCSTKPAFKIQVPSCDILGFDNSIYGVTVTFWLENQQLYNEVFQLITELLMFSPPLPFIFFTRIPYKPSNSQILFHLKSVSFYHATLRYSKLTPCLSPSITTDPLHLNLAFLL